MNVWWPSNKPTNRFGPASTTHHNKTARAILRRISTKLTGTVRP